MRRLRKLDERHVEILRLYAAGLLQKDICKMLEIPLGSVHQEILRIRKVLGADTTCQALAIAIRRGIIA